MNTVEKCNKCEEWTILKDGLCKKCTPVPEFTKRDIATIGKEPKMTNAINEIDHTCIYQCDSCITMSEDPDYNITKVRWYGQSMAEVNTLKTFHEGNNEGHIGVTYER